MQRTHRLGLLVVLGLHLPVVALAQGIESSSWQSTYGDFQGNIPPVTAPLRLQGQTGSYSPGGNYGSLSNITYRPSTTGGALVSGIWSYADTSGWFAFDVAPGGGSFNGSWGYGQHTGQPPVGYWRGTRTGPPAPVPVPVPAPVPVPSPSPAPVPMPFL